MAQPIIVDGYEGLKGVFEEITTTWNDAVWNDALDEILAAFQASHAEYFQNQTTPGGDPWKELAPRTIKEKGHSRILYRTGRLMASLAEQTGDSVRDKWDETINHGVTFGTQVEYAIFHQDGTEHIPQREHVGTNEKQLDEILEFIADQAVAILAKHYGDAT